MKTSCLIVEGMVCSACASTIETALREVEGVETASVSLNEELATVSYDENCITEDVISAEVRELGYRPYANTPENAEYIKRKTLGRFSRSALLAFVVAVILSQPVDPVLKLILATLSQFAAGWLLYRDAYVGLRRKSLNMSFLVMLSSTSAYVFSIVKLLMGETDKLFFDSAAMIIAVVLVGKLIEKRAFFYSDSALKSLVGQFDLSGVEVGQELSVQPGETIPADGVLLEGVGSVDESVITGESRLRNVACGDTVYAGTRNVFGNFTLRVEKRNEDSLYTGIVNAVRRTMGNKSNLQTMTERFVAYFCILVLGVAVLGTLVWLLFLDPGNVEKALLTGMSVLVIACPCAMGIATPLAVSCAMDSATHYNIFFKGGKTLENLSKVDVIAFDKTGTLTKGSSDKGDDTVRPRTKRVLERLKELGLSSLIISGDTREETERIAGEVGISRYYAEVQPEGKMSIIEDLKKDGHEPAMVGDGVNDSPALMESSCGIAVGGRTDIAAEVADVVLMDGTLEHLPDAIRIATVTEHTIRRNLVLSSVYNIIGIGLAVCGILDPVFASLAMSLSSLSVVASTKLQERRIRS